MNSYPHIPLGVTEAEEYQMLCKHVPWLFGGHAGRDMLYVGANQVRPAHNAQRLKQAGWRLHLLEIFAGNVQHHMLTNLFDTLTVGDVRQVVLLGEFDCVFWWHGCEHIAQADLAPTLERLEELALAVVLGCPDGRYAQDTVYGNAAERHLWDVRAADLEELGYAVTTYAAGREKQLLAWKGQTV